MAIVGRKKFRLGRFVLLVVVLLFVLAIAVGGIGYLALDRIISKRVEASATTAIGQPVTLKSANLQLFNGYLALNQMRINNSPGFGEPLFLEFGKCGIHVQTMSLFGSTVNIPQLNIDGLHLFIQQKGLQNNLAPILKHIRAQTAAEGSGKASSGSSGKRLSVGVITLVNTTVTAYVDAPLMGKPRTITLTLPRIVIQEPTNPNGRGLRMADLLGQVIMAVARQAAQDPRLPAPMRTLASAAIDASASKFSAFTQNLQKIGVPHGKTAGEIVQGLGSLLGGNKKPKGRP